MNPTASALLAAGGGYLLGSVSFAKVLARAKGIDLRSVGSGNLGATNAGRALGWQAGVMVYVLDAAKGWAAAAAGLHLGAGAPHAWLEGALAGGLAFAGHVWPVYHGFRGGKGVATLSGAALALAPVALLWSAAVFLVAVVTTRYMSLGSLLLGAALPAALWLLEGAAASGDRLPVLVMLASSGALVFYTHRSNLVRLMHGVENRLGGTRG